jgi:TPP-dependent pyruvate/acetoin dehydrogenase alpha subunit
MPQQMPLKNKQDKAVAGSVSSTFANPAPAQDGFSLISNQKLLQLYATMLKCRLLDEQIRAEREHLSTATNALRGIQLPPRGREAAIAGALTDLLSDDTVAAPPLDLVPLFVTGTPLATLFRVLRQSIAPSFQSGPTPYASDVVVDQAKENKKISVIFSGAKEDQYSWSEALRLASLHHPPTIFVGWKPRKTPTLDFPTMTVDACDVVAVYRVASESIAHARQGFGPTFIECRHWEGPDATRNPLLNMEKYLDRKGLFNKATKAEITNSFGKELDAAVEESQADVSKIARSR